VSTFGAIDFPTELETIAREGFVVSGFAFDEAAGPFTRVVVRHDDIEIASTTLHHRRPDVASAIPAIWNVACGYRAVATLPPGVAGEQVIEVCALFETGASWLQRRSINAGARDYREGPYGTLLHADLPHVYHRSDIYSVGPPASNASAECLDLLNSYLVPGERVIDVGCGIGAYGPALLSWGVDWHGCEINPAFVDQLRGRDLPVTLVESEALPFEDAAFETGMCIEVLEHVNDYDAFLTEVARITRKRAIFSVPNAEAIPVLADQLVVPWHLLEADHKNFFTRAGLRATLERHFRHVEIIPYGLMPIHSSNGAPVYYHLFAVAER